MGVVEYMKKLVKLLNDLESIGLSEQSSILRESINSITKALDKVESNIGEEIIVICIAVIYHSVNICHTGITYRSAGKSTALICVIGCNNAVIKAVCP